MHLTRTALLSLAWVASFGATLSPAAARELSFAERIDCQQTIEAVTWRHTIWPVENAHPKPPFESWLSAEEIAAKAESGPAATWLLARDYDVSVTPEMLQEELDRMARDTRAPGILKEYFDALDGDAFLVAECLARPVISDRLLRRAFLDDARIQSWEEEAHPFAKPDYGEWRRGRTAAWRSLGRPELAGGGSAEFKLPSVATTSCNSWTAISLPPAPQARYLHTAIWTGSEMIVWGGIGGSTYLNTGARYSPVFDLWTPTSLAGAPGARYGHTATWTGTHLIVWGGSLSSGATNTGAQYDPASDSWTATSTTGAPIARYYHTAVWTGSRMIVWGGGTASTEFNTGGRYDPTSDTWLATSTGANVPAARDSHTAVWTGSEMIVFGGYVPPDDSNTGGRYTPSTDSWAALPVVASTPSSRSEHTAIWTGTEMIVWGGRDFLDLTNTGGRFNPSAGTWTATSTGANCPAARFQHTAVWTGTRMIVWGGDLGGVMANTGGSYDPVANSWAGVASSGLVGRTQHSAVWTGSQMIVWGGDTQTGPILGNGARYDPTTNSWKTVGGAFPPQARVDHSTVWTGTEMIVWGGLDGVTPLSDGLRYDPALGNWTPISTASQPARSNHAAVWTGTEMIVWGGDDGAGGYRNTGGRYRPSTGTWTDTSIASGVPEARTGATAVWTGSEMIVWGGHAADVLASGGRYDPATDIWAPTSVLPATPSARHLHEAVWTGSEMIVWGGSTGLSPLVPTDSGGRYSPATDGWTATSSSGSPSPRVSAVSVWIGNEMVVWGGSGSSSPYDTGGRYDPASDTWRTTSVGANLPAARVGHAAVWTGSEMIVWGGTDAMGSQLKTGGRYFPVTDNWIATPVTGATPAPRERHSEAWTGAGGLMVVWGGNPAADRGGLYCPCAAVSWFRDADGDGHGTSLDRLMDCSQPSGYVPSSDDCDDGDPARFPGNTEICDGKDNDCDTVVDDVAPPAAPAIVGARSSETIVVSWSPVVGAASYDVVRGNLALLTSSAGNFSTATLACVVNDAPGTSASDATADPDGQGIWYLVRGNNCGGPGSFDESAGSQAGARDAEIQASGSACP